jgi:hypothetical protein
MARSIGDDATVAIALPGSPILVAAIVYVLLLVLGDRLLNDPDSYWHLVVGQWIAEHGTVPRADLFSHTMAGAPWIAKEWLSQILYAGAYAVGGWTAVVVLAAAAAALAFALLAHFLVDRLATAAALTLTGAAVVLASPHLVARPHVLALPLMVAWIGGLVRALDHGRIPSLALLPLMVLWANLHGGFTLGLALIAPIALEAVWTANRPERRTVAIQWTRFAVLAALAACVTPYGPESILVTYRILSMGDALSIIGEWRAQDFSRLAAFEACLLLALSFALFRGLRLPPMRILVILGLLHLALSHVRNGEILGLLGPLFVAAPLARHLYGTQAVRFRPQSHPFAIASLGAALVAMTLSLATARTLLPSARISPTAAIQTVKTLNAGPILNDYDFGGYLIYAGIAPFIDGRTELYGGAFTLRHHRAVTLQDVGDFFRLLEDHRIGATLLATTTPAVGLLDRLSNWKRVYADDVAVVHVRQAGEASAFPEIRTGRD